MDFAQDRREFNLEIKITLVAAGTSAATSRWVLFSFADGYSDYFDRGWKHNEQLSAEFTLDWESIKLDSVANCVAVRITGTETYVRISGEEIRRTLDRRFDVQAATSGTKI